MATNEITGMTWQALRSLAAVLAGYGVIVIGTVLTFEVWLGGIGYTKSSHGELMLATFGAALSGLAGGYVAAWVGGRKPLWHAIGVLLPLTLDTFYVITSGISSDPLWFDLAGSGTLMMTAVLGGFLRQLQIAKASTEMHYA